MLQKILDRINDAGWNMYECNNKDTIDSIILRGPVRALKAGVQYTLFPKVNQPTNIRQVKEANSYMQQHSIYPIIRSNGMPIGIALIVVEQDKIKVRSITDKYFSYSDFLQVIATLKPTTLDSMN